MSCVADKAGSGREPSLVLPLQSKPRKEGETISENVACTPTRSAALLKFEGCMVALAAAAIGVLRWRQRQLAAL